MSQPLVGEFEATALDRATRMTNASLRRSLRGLRERLLAEPLEQRQARSALDRRVCLESEPDGMAWLSFFLEGERATAIQARLDALAGASVDDRTTAQRALDIAADLLLRQSGRRRWGRPRPTRSSRRRRRSPGSGADRSAW